LCRSVPFDVYSEQNIVYIDISYYKDRDDIEVIRLTQCLICRKEVVGLVAKPTADRGVGGT